MISIANFSKTYQDTLILSIPSLRFETGIYWIQGYNGSGKSTFFRSLAGLIPFTGEVVFDDGVDLHKNPVQYRKVVNYSEAEALYPGFLTAKDLVYFVAKAKDATPAQRDKIVRQFNLISFYEKPCSTYSSGMLKKLSLALAFLGNPRLIILDEPLITLDEASKNILLHYIKESSLNSPTTFLISSHQVIDPLLLPIKACYQIINKALHQL